MPHAFQAALEADGTGLARQDGAIPDELLYWYSNLSGFLGAGSQLDASELAVGEHHITVTATDAQGEIATATVSISVTEKLDGLIAPNTEDPGEPGTGDRNADGLPDWWTSLYFGGPTNVNADAMAANGIHTVREAFVAGIDPTRADAGLPGPWLSPPETSGPQWVIPGTLLDRIYGLYGTTNLLLPVSLWPLIAPERYGTGGDLRFDITNETPAQFIRTGIRQPE